MAKLIYAAITSLDGYVADKAGSSDWAAPDEAAHTFSPLTGGGRRDSQSARQANS